MSGRKRRMETLTRADIGKRIVFCSSQGRHVEGVLRAFTHGVFSNSSRGEVDVPLVGVNIYALRSHEHHWASPDALALLTAIDPEPSDSERSAP